MVFNPNYRLQSDEERNKYLNQLYGGSPPSMDYYRQLGTQKRMNDEARKAAEKAAREREKEMEKAAEKAAEEQAVNDLLAQLSQTSPQQSAGSSRSSNKSGGGILDTLGGMVGSVGQMAGEGLKNAFQLLNPFDDVGMDEIRERTKRSQQEREKEKGYKDARNLAHSITGGATFGGLQNPDYVEDGAINTIGQLLGSLHPGARIVQGLQGTRAAANVTQGMGHGQRAAQRAKEGMTAGGIYGGLDAAASEMRDPNERNFGDHLRNIGLETAFGGVVDPAVGRLLDAIPSNRLVTRPGDEDLRPGQASSEARQRELLGLPEPQQRLPEPALELPRPTDPYDPTAMSRVNELFTMPTQASATSRMGNLEDIISLQDTRRQAQQADELLSSRQAEFEAQNQAEIQSSQARQAELQADYEEMRKAFIDEGVDPYTNEGAMNQALAEWDSVKKLRDDYDNIRKTVSKFKIPDLYREEYGSLVPRNFISRSSGSDIFDAAAEAGFPPGHEGALEFAQFLRNGVEAKKTRMKDLVPKEQVPESQIGQVRDVMDQTFPETEDAQALQRVIDAYDTQIEQLRNREFTSTEEYQSTQRIIQAMQQEIQSIQQRLVSMQQRPNPLADLGLLQPGNTARFADMPTAQPNPADAPRLMPETVPARPGMEPEMPPVANEPPMAPIDDPNAYTFDRGDGGIMENTNMGARDMAIQRTTDDLHGIKLSEEIANVESNMYRNARLTRGAGGAYEVYAKQTLEPAVRQLEQSGKLLDGNQYIMDKHLLRVKELNPEYRIPGGKSEEAMRANVARLENDPEIRAFSESVRQYQRGILDMLEEAEILSPEAKQELIENYPDYVPLFRSLQKKREKLTLDDVFQSYENISRGNVRKAIMELSEHGSENVTNRPIDNLVQYGINSYHAAFSNRAMKELSKLDGIKVNGKPLAKKVAPKTEKQYPKDNIVTFFENGQSVKYYVNDDIRRSLESLKGVTQFDEVANFFHGLAKIQRQSITANPLFSMRQIVRDIPQAWVVGDFSLFRDLIPAFMDSITQGRALGNSSMLNKFFEHGGGMSNMVSFDRSPFTAMQRASKKLKQRGITEVSKDNIVDFTKSWFDKIRNFNEALENTPKLAQFRATARRTGDMDQAAFDARDIMDFSRSGESVRTINRYAAFINATIQGRSKQFREMKRPEVWLKTAIAGALPSIGAYMAYNTYASEEQRRIINESPEWQRQTYWLIPDWNNENNVWRIPKPYEVAMLSSTPIEFMLYNDDKVGTEPKDALVEWFNQAIFVDPSLNPLTPAYELATGVDTFTGQPIVPTAEQGLPAGEQYDVRTNPIARGISSLTGGNVSPRNIEHALEGYLPMLSATAGDLVGGAMDKAGLSQNPAPTGTRRVPFLDDFRIRGENYQANTLIGEAHTAQEEVQNLRGQTMDDGQLFPYNNAYRAMNQVTQRDSELASQIRRIDNDPNLSADEKAVRRQALLQERNANVRGANEAGLTSSDEADLASAERRWSGLGAENTRTEYERVIVAQLVQNGIPEVDALELMERAKAADWDMQRLASEVANLVRNR